MYNNGCAFVYVNLLVHFCIYHAPGPFTGLDKFVTVRLLTKASSWNQVANWLVEDIFTLRVSLTMF